jgi:predicted dehydrogenase
MNQGNIVKLAIAGIGQRGCAYIKMALGSGNVKLTALCDSNMERMKTFAGEAGCDSQVKYFTSYDEMLDRMDIDAVIITVPDFLHAEFAIKALNRDKHVMLEKPMALTVAECEKIIAALRKSRGGMQMGFVLREHPVYKKIKEIVDSGRLGQIMSISADESLGVMHGASYMRRWHRKISQSGGFLLTKCSHDLDLISWMVDSDPVRVSSFGSCDFFTSGKLQATHCSKCADHKCRFRFKGEMVRMTPNEKAAPSEKNFDLCVYNKDKDSIDSQVCMIEYANRVRAVFSLNLFAPTAKRTMKIFGSEGYLEADTELGEIRVTSSLGLPPKHFQYTSDNNSGHGGSDLPFFTKFIDGIVNGIAPTVDYRAGVRSTLLGTALERARLTGKIIKLQCNELSTCNN